MIIKYTTKIDKIEEFHNILGGTIEFMPTYTQLQQFGRLIRERRGRMSAAELGEKIGRSQSYISALENAAVAKGKTKPITPHDDVLAALSRVLDIPLRELHAALGRLEGEPMPIEYEPILDELYQASYNGGLDSEAVAEIVTYIQFLAERRRKRQGRA